MSIICARIFLIFAWADKTKPTKKSSDACYIFFLTELLSDLSLILYKLLFLRGFYFREFRDSGPHKNFHFNLCLFIVMKSSEKSQN